MGPSGETFGQEAQPRADETRSPPRPPPAHGARFGGVDPDRRDFDAWLAYTGETAAPRPVTRREDTLLEDTLYEEQLLPVCSPALLAARGRPRGPAVLCDWPLLYDLGCNLTDHGLLTRCAGLRPGPLDTPTASAKHTLRALARRWMALTEEIAIHDQHLARLTTETSPTLREGFGVGAHSAAELLIIFGDNPDRRLLSLIGMARDRAPGLPCAIGHRFWGRARAAGR